MTLSLWIEEIPISKRAGQQYALAYIQQKRISWPTDDFMMRHVSPFCRAPGYMLPARKYSSRNKLNLVFYVVNIDLNDLLTHKTKLN